MNLEEAMYNVEMWRKFPKAYLRPELETGIALYDEIERLQAMLPPTAHTGVRNGPGEGSWSAFAEKVVAERDAAITEYKQLQAKFELLRLELNEKASRIDYLRKASEQLEMRLSAIESLL